MDIILSKTQRKTPTVIHKNFKISRIRRFYMTKVKYTQQNFHDKLTAILTEFPKLEVSAWWAISLLSHLIHLYCFKKWITLCKRVLASWIYCNFSCIYILSIYHNLKEDVFHKYITNANINGSLSLEQKNIKNIFLWVLTYMRTTDADFSWSKHRLQCISLISYYLGKIIPHL